MRFCDTPTTPVQLPCARVIDIPKGTIFEGTFRATKGRWYRTENSNGIYLVRLTDDILYMGISTNETVSDYKVLDACVTINRS